MKKIVLITALSVPLSLFTINPLEEQSGEREWIEKTYQSMSLEQKIGQLFIPRSIPGYLLDDSELVKRLITEYGIGGVIFMSGDASKQVILTNEYQKLSPIPLLICQDAEYGVAMRLQGLPALPQQLMLGAIQDNDLIERYAEQVARQCVRLGVHVNFAPVADVNNNPENPVIGNRSFGENVENVTHKVLAFIKGLHKGGILACIKHFPGHGDTSVDSHEALPVIVHDKDRLQAVELVPFKKGIEEHVAAIMTAHLHIPALDDIAHIPSSLSQKVVTDLLVHELGFKGFIFTDGLRMKGVRGFVGNDDGSTELEAFKAGNTFLLETPFVKEGCEKIKEAVLQDGVLLQKLELTVKNILSLKYRLGLSYGLIISSQDIEDSLLSEEFWQVKKECIDAALTHVGSDTTSLNKLADYVRKNMHYNKPLEDLAMVVFNSPDFIPLTTALRTDEASCMLVHGPITQEYQEGLIKNLEHYKHIVIAVHGMNQFAKKRFGVSELVEKAVKEIVQKYPQAIVVILGSPYALTYFKNCPQLIVTYDADPLTQVIAAQKLLSGAEFKGKLPISFN